MTALLVIVLFLAFVGADILVRLTARKMAERQALQAREAALETSVRLDFSHEAPSLKRVEVANPRGRILAVDDEPVVLDSLRKILVLDGFNVDTVESGPEALGLVQRRDYDFVFTDLKMPGMDGVEVVKAVKHLRPDVDVAVITGYGTIETAVATMKHGAVDYVQKPFTADELSDFAGKQLIRRQARLESQRAPTVKLLAQPLADSAASHEYCVAGGAFFSPQHAWARIEPDGQVRLGLDDFARKALGPIEHVDLPQRGAQLRRGEPMVTLRRGEDVVRLPAPLTGKVTQVNGGLSELPAPVCESPYNRGWVCLMQPASLVEDLESLRIGQPVVTWYQEEIARLRKLGTLPIEWQALQREFLTPRPVVLPSVAPARKPAPSTATVTN